MYGDKIVLFTMGRPALDLAGKKFGKLTVIERISSDKQASQWLCKCDCGTEKIFNGGNIAHGGTYSCGCARVENLVGQQFYFLTVLNRSKKKDGKHTFWDCTCECGNIIIATTDQLKAGMAKSCGCKSPKKACATKEEAINKSAKKVYNKTYNDGDLTFEKFFELSQKKCYYCGVNPLNKSNVFLNSNSSSKFGKENGTFIYNGLDRIDSNLPHDLNNVVPCCIRCNRAKWDSSINEFETWIIRLIEYYPNRIINKIT